MAKYDYEFKKKVIKNKSTSDIEEKPIDISAEYIKELEDENLKLRIENAYLRELRRLRLEEEALLNKQDKAVTEFDEGLWISMVECVTVYAKDDVRVEFKNGIVI